MGSVIYQNERLQGDFCIDRGDGDKVHWNNVHKGPNWIRKSGEKKKKKMQIMVGFPRKPEGNARNDIEDARCACGFVHFRCCKMSEGVCPFYVTVNANKAK